MTTRNTQLAARTDAIAAKLARYEAIGDCLGFPGAMLSGSKCTPLGKEDHTIYWNACVFDSAGTQIWHGDLDVTDREADLRALAQRLGEAIWVTPEQPWRFDGFAATMKVKDYAERAIKFEVAA